MNEKNKDLPIFNSILGLAIIISYSILAFTFTQNYLAPFWQQGLNSKITNALFSNAFYWKPFAIFCLTLGLFFYDLLAINFSRFKNTKFWILSIALFLFLILGILTLVSKQTINNQAFFLPLIRPILTNSFQNVLLMSQIIIPLLYGCIIILIGIWAGMEKWLHEYHFHYSELKRTFHYSLILFGIWHLLKYIGVYSFINDGVIGQAIYMVDALTVSLLLVFMYLFLLIYLENFKLGKQLLKGLYYLGSYWYINFLFLGAIALFLK